MEDGYFVKWEKHHNAIVSVFDSLYKDNVLVDCTLAAENRFIKAHRLVLMACSPYFEELLSQHSDNYPILLLNMKFSELQALVDFCYRGEVKLPQNELPGFLNAARLLHIKGLCESTDTYKKRRLEEDSVLRKRLRLVPQPGIVSDVIVGGHNLLKKEEVASPSVIPPKEPPAPKQHIAIAANGGTSNSMAGGDSDRSDVDTDDLSSGDEGVEGDSQLEEHLLRTSMWYRWTCGRCGEAFPRRAPYSEHRKVCTGPADEEEHPWCCHQCPNSYKNKKDLVRHLLYCGVDTQRHICERCGNTYKYERGLKRHKVYCGTDVKPMVCPRCGKTYKYKRGLRRHQQQQCGIDELFVEHRAAVKAQEVKHETPPAATSPKENPISLCKICGKQYKYRKSFLHHVRMCVAMDGVVRLDQSADSQQNDSTTEDINLSPEPETNNPEPCKTDNVVPNIGTDKPELDNSVKPDPDNTDNAGSKSVETNYQEPTETETTKEKVCSQPVQTDCLPSGSTDPCLQIKLESQEPDSISPQPRIEISEPNKLFSEPDLSEPNPSQPKTSPT